MPRRRRREQTRWTRLRARWRGLRGAWHLAGEFGEHLSPWAYGMIVTANILGRDVDDLRKDRRKCAATLDRIMCEQETLRQERDDARAELSEEQAKNVRGIAGLTTSEDAKRRFPEDPEALLECCRRVVATHPRINSADVAKHWPRKGAS